MVALPTRALLFVVTAFLIGAVYLGFAYTVLLQQPRRTIGWVFAGFSLLVANHYLTSLFLFPSGGLPESMAHALLRWKWAAASFLPALFLHLAWFYFAPSWKRPWVRVLSVLYGACVVLAGTAMFTNLVVAGVLDRGAGSIVGPEPGPLMPLTGALLAIAFLSSIGGMVVNYRKTRLGVLRRQIGYLLTPAALTAAVIAINMFFILSRARENAPHELGHVVVLLMAYYYGRAVLGYGSVVDRPVQQRRLLRTVLLVATGTAALAAGFTVDRLLIPYAPIAFPFVTSLLLIAFVAGVLFFQARQLPLLERRSGKEHAHKQVVVKRIAENLADVPEPEALQEALLNTVCDLLQTVGAFTATIDGEGTATVQQQWGDMTATPGDVLPLPALNFRRPRLISALMPELEWERGWYDVAVVCPLGDEQGILALGEKKDETPFTAADLELCQEAAQRVTAVEEMKVARRQQEQLLVRAHEAGHRLQRLHEQVMASPLTAKREQAPLAIGALGPLEIRRKGKRVAEREWRTEKAKGMLAYLLWKGRRGATREELCEALWPERSLEEAANTFHVTLHRLRRVLEPHRARGSSYVRHRLGRYRFDFDSPHELDVTRFRKLVAVGSNNLRALKEAVEMYRGEHLQGLYWALPAEAEIERRHLENLYTEALRTLSERSRGKEREEYLERLLRLVPADEWANGVLVQAYMQEGRLDLARRQLGRWEVCLEEVGLEPPEALRRLQRNAAVS